ncbi:O-antigen ligase domain-containing protein [Mucilaginibacter limnophilus]|uniref:O-antigen ligase domain-containing protein n=1 Tax=Mucilaginibacter limnophilus TaxID=1932778 RepID=A0A3S2VQ24_9SPHI|nr:O-antigen ligase family protein [Mucilaginibacter limnophilus]RVU02706.1 O-antigen ligase domain-containing protein [Mucilaginibacter limnophilus]
MDNFQLKIDNTRRVNLDADGFTFGLKKISLLDRLNKTSGVAIFLVIAIAIAIGTGLYGVKFTVMILAAAIALPVVAGVLLYPEFGMVVVVMMAYLLFLLTRIGVSGPVGVIMDGLQVLMMVGLAVKQRTEHNWDMLKGPVTTMILVWIGYNVFEFANPAAESRLAWVYTIRTVAIVLLLYFVFLYNIRTIKMVRLLFKIWLALALFAALYGYKQEYIGFSAVEDAYLHSDPAIADLLFIGGHWRKFSIFSDPVSFGYNMVMAAIIGICILEGKFSLWKKIVVGICVCMYLHSMLFSGTRAANPLVPAAMALFAVIKYNKKILMLAILGVFGLIVLINIPTSNPNLVRFQTAFRPNNDDSYNLRKFNQKRIQPFIQSHPIGGGLGATGTWGKRFAPGSYLANFPPDSGYMRIAVELGWIGLIIFCTLMFTIMKTGINNYYRIKNPELKTYCLAMTLVVFAYNIANFPQEALVQYPSNLLFSLAAALISVTYRIDRQQRRPEEAFNEKEVIRYQ